MSLANERVDLLMAEERQQMRTKQQLYDLFLLLTLSYGILVTWFAGIWLPGFQEGCALFSSQALTGLAGLWTLLTLLPEQISQAAPETAAGLQSLLWLAVLGAELYGICWAGWRGLRQLISFSRSHLANRQTAAALLVIFAAGVFFAGPVQAAAGISILWWIFLALAGYTAAVWVRSRR